MKFERGDRIELELRPTPDGRRRFLAGTFDYEYEPEHHRGETWVRAINHEGGWGAPKDLVKPASGST